MNLLIVLGALIFLMFVAYRGYSVILFAPIAALGAVLLTDPSLVPPLFSSVFMEKMVGFVKNYFPVFMLGAVSVDIRRIVGSAGNEGEPDPDRLGYRSKTFREPQCGREVPAGHPAIGCGIRRPWRRQLQGRGGLIRILPFL